MMQLKPLRFLAGMETECLTVPQDRGKTFSIADAAAPFLASLGRLAPWLYGKGVCDRFSAYGRTYIDLDKLELASAERESPYGVAQVNEQHKLLVANALQSLPVCDQLIVANVNHDGVLTDTSDTWGCHGNFLVAKDPTELTDQLLPFLATSNYTGAGAVHYPTGNLLGSVRHHFLVQDTGGSTQQRRSLFGGVKSENGYIRYHPIHADSNRSQYSESLHCGQLMLVLAALQNDPSLIVGIPELRPPHSRRSLWMETLRTYNVLTAGDRPPRVEPVVLQVQQVYLDAVRRYFSRLVSFPEWVPRLIDQWEQTIRALLHEDHAWLAARLDPWIKYNVICDFLAAEGKTWSDLRSKKSLHYPLALLNQNYHEFANPQSVFSQLEEAGMLAHRVAPQIPPGGEPEPFVPATSTRAQARARFIRDHSGEPGLQCDWSSICDETRYQRWSLEDPFADAFSQVNLGIRHEA